MIFGFFDAEFDFDFVIEVLYFGAFGIFLLSEKEVLFGIIEPYDTFDELFVKEILNSSF